MWEHFQLESSVVSNLNNILEGLGCCEIDLYMPSFMMWPNLTKISSGNGADIGFLVLSFLFFSLLF